MNRRRTGPRLAAAACSAVLLLAAGCSADALSSEVVAQDAAPQSAADGPHGAESGPGAEDAEPGPCVIPDVMGSSWVPTQKEQEAKRAVFKVLDEQFPQAPGKTDPDRQLREGLIGIAIDPDARGYVAVVDPTLVDVAALEAKLKSAADAEHARRPGVRAVKMRAQGGCHSAEELLDSLQRIPGIIQSHAGQVAWSVSAYDSRIHIEIDPADPIAAALREQLGDRISFED
jgi:hypothetical protein